MKLKKLLLKTWNFIENMNRFIIYCNQLRASFLSDYFHKYSRIYRCTKESYGLLVTRQCLKQRGKFICVMVDKLVVYFSKDHSLN